MFDMKSLINEYDFNSIDEFYDYIIDTSENGQFKQLKDLMSQVDVCEFSDYLAQIDLPKDRVLRIMKFSF